MQPHGPAVFGGLCPRWGAAVGASPAEASCRNAGGAGAGARAVGCALLCWVKPPSLSLFTVNSAAGRKAKEGL